jgi:hypothetical protein
MLAKLFEVDHKNLFTIALPFDKYIGQLNYFILALWDITGNFP